jgi:L-arabinose isomerase
MYPKQYHPLRIGLFGIGLEAYWAQFEGLQERLEGYVQVVGGRLERPCVEVVNLGLIDSPEPAMEVSSNHFNTLFFLIEAAQILNKMGRAARIP